MEVEKLVEVPGSVLQEAGDEHGRDRIRSHSRPRRGKASTKPRSGVRASTSRRCTGSSCTRTCTRAPGTTSVARCRGGPDTCSITPGQTHFSRVTASNLVEVGPDGRPAGGEGRLNVSAWAIHAPVQRARPDIMCALHIHAPYSTALASIDGWRLDERGSQNAAVFYGNCAYFGYEGIVTEADEGERMVEALGDKRVLFPREPRGADRRRHDREDDAVALPARARLHERDARAPDGPPDPPDPGRGGAAQRRHVRRVGRRRRAISRA